MNRVCNRLYVVVMLALFFLQGCATQSPASLSPDDATTYSNILVIGVANDYEGRSRFERKLANDLKKAGVTATPLYVAADGNKPISRELVEGLINTDGYDAVLITRALEQDASTTMRDGSAATKAVRRDGRPLDLFRYNYEELNEPADVDFNFDVRLSTELFSTAQESQVWNLEMEIAAKDYADLLINEASERIVRRLKRDEIIDR
ncbi:MAG: hypothetical protein AAF660_10415 [Pseudomonadota bacterium]